MDQRRIKLAEHKRMKPLVFPTQSPSDHDEEANPGRGERGKSSAGDAHARSSPVAEDECPTTQNVDDVHHERTYEMNVGSADSVKKRLETESDHHRRDAEQAPVEIA